MVTSKNQQIRTLPLKTFLERIGQTAVPNSYVPDTQWGNTEPLLRSDQVNRLLLYCGAFNPPHIGHATVIADALQHCLDDPTWGDLTAVIVAPMDETAGQEKAAKKKAAQPNPAAKEPLLLTSKQRCDLLTSYFHGSDSNVRAQDRPKVQVWGPGRLRGVAEFPGPITAAAAVEGFQIELILLRGSDHMYYTKDQKTSFSYDPQCSAIIFTEVAGRVNPETWEKKRRNKMVPKPFSGGWTPWTEVKPGGNIKSFWSCQSTGKGSRASEIRLLINSEETTLIAEGGFSSTKIRKIVDAGGSQDDMIRNLKAGGALSTELLISMLPTDSDLYQTYVDQFTSVDDFIAQLPAGGPTKADFQIVDFSDLTVGSSFSGLNETKIVSIQTSTDQYVYKGAYYETWLRRHKLHLDRPWEKFSRGLYEEHSLIPELLVLCTMPGHPNIFPRPNILVVTGTTATPQKLCGFLSPLRMNQTIEEQVVRANAQGYRIALGIKAQWCLGMAEGILHTHRAANTFHMDMKPANVLLEDNGTTPVIIDWQQQGMFRGTHPPTEATLSTNPKIRRIVDRMRVGPDGQPLLIFAPTPGTWPETGLREAYTKWKAENPRGIEAAEVYMLGRTMWMVLEQVAEADAAATQETTWKSMDIPESWWGFVMRCLEDEPAHRLRIEDVVRFWQDQVTMRDLRDCAYIINLNVNCV